MSAPGHAFERISVIIPTLDEAGNLTALLADVDRGREVETIVVDGGSRDDTVARARQLGARVIAGPPLRGISSPAATSTPISASSASSH